jgi:hypothetical protein
MLFIIGCDDPGLMEAVTASLAEEVQVAAEPGMTLSLDTAGLVAEICSLDVLKDYVFSGAAANGLEIAVPDTFLEKQDGSVEFQFFDVMVGDQLGTLVLSGESARVSWDVLWENYAGVSTGLLEGSVAVERCSSESIRLSGALEWSDADRDVTITIGNNGRSLDFDPLTLGMPLDGQGIWNGSDSDLEATIVLDSAELGITETGWTGMINGKGWTHGTIIKFP